MKKEKSITRYIYNLTLYIQNHSDEKFASLTHFFRLVLLVLELDVVKKVFLAYILMSQKQFVLLIGLQSVILENQSFKSAQSARIGPRKSYAK